MTRADPKIRLGITLIISTCCDFINGLIVQKDAIKLDHHQTILPSIPSIISDVGLSPLAGWMEEFPSLFFYLSKRAASLLLCLFLIAYLPITSLLFSTQSPEKCNQVYGKVDKETLSGMTGLQARFQLSEVGVDSLALVALEEVWPLSITKTCLC